MLPAPPSPTPPPPHVAVASYRFYFLLMNVACPNVGVIVACVADGNFPVLTSARLRYLEKGNSSVVETN